MFDISENYRVGSNNTNKLFHLKGPYELNSPPNNRTFWGRNENNERVLCYTLEGMQRIYSVTVDQETLRQYINGEITFRSIIEANDMVYITDGQLYGDDLIKKYYVPIAQIPESEIGLLGYYLIPPPENKGFYIL